MVYAFTLLLLIYLAIGECIMLIVMVNLSHESLKSILRRGFPATDRKLNVAT